MEHTNKIKSCLLPKDYQSDYVKARHNLFYEGLTDSKVFKFRNKTYSMSIYQNVCIIRHTFCKSLVKRFCGIFSDIGQSFHSAIKNCQKFKKIRPR